MPPTEAAPREPPRFIKGEIGEYLAGAFNEVKARPPCLVERRVGSRRAAEAGVTGAAER